MESLYDLPYLSPLLSSVRDTTARRPPPPPPSPQHAPSPSLDHSYRRIYVFLMVKRQNGHSAQTLGLACLGLGMFRPQRNSHGRSSFAILPTMLPSTNHNSHLSTRNASALSPIDVACSRALVLSRHNDACCVFLVPCPVSLDVRLAVVVGSLAFQREIVCLCASDSLFNHILHAHLSTLKDLFT